MRNYPKSGIIFIEQDDGTLINKDGYSIVTVNTGSEGLRSDRYQLVTPQGDVVDESNILSLLFHGDEKVRIVSLEARKGRKVGHIKLGTHHFTKGTVFKATLIGKEEKEYTVQHLICNGPGSYCIVTTSPRTENIDLFGEGFESFNTDWATSIVKRVPGNPVIKEEPMPLYGGFKHGKPRTVNQYLASIRNVHGQVLNYEKLKKRLSAMGFIKNGLISHKRASKVLSKNPSWGLYSLKESIAIDQERYYEPEYD